MQTNGNSNGHEDNGRTRTPVTRLTDMGVEVIDAPTSLTAEQTKESATSSTNGKSTGAARDQNEQAKQSILNEDDAPASVELLDAEDKQVRRKRVMVAAVVVIALLIVLAGIGYFWLSSASRNEMAYRVKPPSTPTSAEKAGEQKGITAEEIARELRKPEAANNGTGSQNPSGTNNTTVSSSSTITDRLPNEDYSATVPSSNVATQSGVTTTSASSGTNQVAAPSANTQPSPTTEATITDSSFSTERSIRVSTSQPRTQDNPNNIARSTAGMLANPDASNEQAIKSASVTTKSAVPLPPLGTMLLVRTLGTVFTLRSDSYVRLQLTREMSGRGWSLPRGTEFYGVMRGAELETGRAFINLIGFIDKNTNRLVRLQGNLLGSDGADGVRGRKHKLNAGWANALKKVGAGVVDVLSSVPASVGRRPIVVSDIYGSSAPRVVDPIAREISGITYTGDARTSGFVEVPAGTSGYILVMTSPQEIQGVDTDVSVAAPELQRYSDANIPREQGQLTEQQVAELLTNGSTDDIRSALPRMTPEMRRVAESFLANK